MSAPPTLYHAPVKLSTHEPHKRRYQLRDNKEGHKKRANKITACPSIQVHNVNSTLIKVITNELPKKITKRMPPHNHHHTRSETPNHRRNTDQLQKIKETKNSPHPPTGARPPVSRKKELIFDLSAAIIIEPEGIRAHIGDEAIEATKPILNGKPHHINNSLDVVPARHKFGSHLAIENANSIVPTGHEIPEVITIKT